MTIIAISCQQMKEIELNHLRERVKILENKLDKLLKFVDHCAFQLDMEYARETLTDIDEIV